MLYILESTHNIHVGHRMHPAQVESYLDLLKARKESGHIVGIYSKIGGGTVAIVDYPDAQTLFNRLRQLGIHGVEVTPVFETTEVLATYHEHHKASGAYDAAHQHDGEGEHPVEAAKAKAKELHDHSAKAHAAAKAARAKAKG